MLFASRKQMRWMFANKPKLARKWVNTYGVPRKKKRGKSRKGRKT